MVPGPPPPLPYGERPAPRPVRRPVTRLAGRVLGSGAAFDTFSRQPRMFWPWVTFWIPLTRRSGLSRPDTELAILRTAWNCGSSYEWQRHGGSAQVAEGPAAKGWTPRQRVLLTAVDELCTDRMISDRTWAELSAHFTERQLTALCLLVGNSAMTAMALNSFGVRDAHKNG